jgi:hypothetical protein
MTPENLEKLLHKKSWLRNFHLSEGQIKHLTMHMPYTSAGLFVVGYVEAVLKEGKLPAQIEHETIDRRLDPEPPNTATEEYAEGYSAGEDAPSGVQGG